VVQVERAQKRQAAAIDVKLPVAVEDRGAWVPENPVMNSRFLEAFFFSVQTVGNHRLGRR